MRATNFLTPFALVSLLAAGTLGQAPKGQPAKANPARLKGMKGAIADIENGVLKQKEYPPLPYAPSYQDFIGLLKSECGVEWQVINSPAYSKKLRDEVGGYNDVMRTEIEHRFGRGIIEKLRSKTKDKSTAKDYTEFKLEESRALWLRPVAPKKDLQTGFVLGGKNPTSLIRKLKQLNGRSIAELEEDMRPGAKSKVGSTAGFLGSKEQLREVLAQDNDYVVDKMGMTHQKLAKHLLVMGAIGLQHLDGREVEFKYHTRHMKLKANATLGYQYSPFMDGTRSNIDITVHNLDNGKTLEYSLLVPLMIDRYGFYEGKGTPYRVEPAQVLAVFDFL